MKNWFEAWGIDLIPSPALLVYPERIAYNIRLMTDIAASPERLRPHVKTHKMSEVVALCIKSGIKKYKCSTIAEAEMCARCNADDVLLAFQPVGIQIKRFLQLQKTFPLTKFSTVADNSFTIAELNILAGLNQCNTDIWIDINNGMNRTGIAPGNKVLELIEEILAAENLFFRGLHVYDGHIHETDPEKRSAICNNDYEPVTELLNAITAKYGIVSAVVAGGTPTFPIHANRPDVELSPGTCVLWDEGYSHLFPDLKFQPAAVILTRVISKPGKDLLCLDLGHKAIAAEMPQPRVVFPNIQIRRIINHSEEHLVIEVSDEADFVQGSAVYGIPWHICPTVPRYPSAFTVINGKIAGEWKIDARDRMITI